MSTVVTPSPELSRARSTGAVFAAKYPLFMRAAYLIIWVLALIAVGKAVAAYATVPAVFGQDSHAYWNAAQGPLEYSRAAGTLDAYLYSPAFLTLISPISWLPWPAFLAVWTVLLASVAVWLVKPAGWKWGVPLFLCAVPEMLVSNIFLLLAATVVLGFRYPGMWAFAVLTKVTTGVGLVWFLARGEWRKLAVGVGVTAAVVAVSCVLDSSAWVAWVHFLLTNRDGTEDGMVSFVIRAVAAVALVAVAARKKWPWVIPAAMYLSTPVLVSLVPLAILLAVPRLLLQRPQVEGPADPRADR